jgi:hypothetical protein
MNDDDALRDRFAAEAMNAFIAGGIMGLYSPKEMLAALARSAFDVADAMLTERARRDGRKP